MDILFYLKQKNLIFLVLVSVISFYIIRTIDCCTDTFYPYIYSKLGIKENEMIKQKGKIMSSFPFLIPVTLHSFESIEKDS